MKVIGLSGWSGAGKTTLLTRLIPHLIAEGLRVSTMKHAHSNFDVDIPGKDSWLHRQAGATEVLISSGRRWTLMHELRGEPEPPLTDLLAKMSRVDLLIVEGFKADRHPKIAADIAVNMALPYAHLDDIPAISRIMRAAAVRIEDVLAHEAAGA